MDSSYERTSHVEPLPMDGGDLPTQLRQMDLNNETPSQAEPPLPMVGEEWRTQLSPDSRQSIVNKISDTLRRHLPVSGEEGLQEVRKIALRFEEKIYSAATSQSDYLRKISLKMLTMASKSQSFSGSRANSDDIC